MTIHVDHKVLMSTVRIVMLTVSPSDGFFVPHGYLSDDEGDEDCDGISEEAKKKRLEMRRQQFEEEQRNRVRRLNLYYKEIACTHILHKNASNTRSCLDRWNEGPPFLMSFSERQTDNKDRGAYLARRRTFE